MKFQEFPLWDQGDKEKVKRKKIKIEPLIIIYEKYRKKL